MAVSTTDTFTGPLLGNGITTVFPFTFKAVTAAEVLVERDVSGVRETVSPLSYDVTVSDAGGLVTFAAPPVDGVSIYVISDPFFTQEVEFANQERFGAEAVNEVNDRAAVRDLKLRGDTDRAIKLAVGATRNDIVPVPGKFLGFDADGQPIALSGTGADNGLRPDLADSTAGSSLVAYRERSVKAKLDDWCTPLDYGAAGDGVTLDTTAIDAAFATGKHVVFPKGYTFLTNTKDGHYLISDGQTCEINGSLIHNGQDFSFGGGLHGFLSIIRGADTIERLQIFGSGVINGARPTFTAGHKGSGLWLERNPQAMVDGIRFEEFIDNGIHAMNCAEIDLRSGVHCYRTRNCGYEIKSYADNPFAGIAGNAEWTGPIYGPSGNLYGTFEFIDDGLKMAGNGCGILLAAGDGSPRPTEIRVGGTYLDCLTAFQSENNYAGSEVVGLTFDNLFVRGNIRGAGTAECSDGVTLINCFRVRGSMIIRDCTNIAPPPGADTAGLNLVACQDVNLDVSIDTNTGIANRMQYGVLFNASQNVELTGAVSGASVKGIQKNGNPTHVRVQAVRGGEADETWAATAPYSFSYPDVPLSSSNLAMRADGNAGFAEHVMVCPGRAVGVTGRLSVANPTATFTIKVKIGGVEQTGLTLTQTDFGAGQQFAKRLSTMAALQAATLDQITTEITTNASWDPATDVLVRVFVDHGIKA